MKVKYVAKDKRALYNQRY